MAKSKRVHRRSKRRRTQRRSGGGRDATVFFKAAYPAPSPPLQTNTIFNQQGGNCGCGLFGGGAHRVGCKCSECAKKIQGGGGSALVGEPFSASHLNQLPGVDGIDGNRNYFPLNTYPTDVSRQTVVSLQGGRRRRIKHKRKKGGGGSLTSLLPQDLVNLGRQFQFGVGSAYNALAGVAPPVNPLPWKDQLPDVSSMTQARQLWT